MSNGIVIPFENKLKCSICQDRLKDARILPCGHTYCKECITGSVQASYDRGIVKCSECQKSTRLPAGGVDSIPRCFTLNFLLEEIQRTFGPSGQKVDILPHGFQAREMFACAICIGPLRDARYLQCGHCFCKSCLAKQNSSGQNKCCKCQKLHNLPSGGLDSLPVAYRVNSITAEFSHSDSGEDDSAGSSCSSLGTANGRLPTTGRGSSGRLVDDVAREKALAKAAARRTFQVFVQKLDGKTVTIDTCSQDTIRELRRKIHAKTNIAPSQQVLTYGSTTLNEEAKTVQDYNIGQHATIHLSARLRGGRTS
ncbi:uncharacterized protein [Diadema antillarum]|uniref:uncharacterized protein n=1 Tax=Diadema antillarum TaxID=105358 RepID=UPI003A85AA43